MKKNFIIVILGAVCCLAVAFGVWFVVYICQHRHAYGDWITDNDYHWRECKNDGCDEKITEKSAHTDANNDGKCDICLIKHEHAFGKTVIEPTCTKQGYTEYTCLCGYHYRDEYADALGHDYGEDNLCTRCGYFKHEHEYEESVIPPTCTAGGYTRGDCKYCTAGYFIDRTAPLGHDYADGKCTRCGEWRPTDGLQYTISGDGSYYTCSGVGTATDTQIIIAREYDGKPVTVIARNAFFNNREIKRVIIPDTVFSIGASAFEYCTELTEITVPDSVTVIGKRAFYQCRGMTKATVGRVVGDQMFQYCSSLESVIIPDTVTSIGKWAFAVCENLQTAVIPNSVTEIGEYAFYRCNNLQTINIPVGITAVKEYAFYGCEAVTDVKLSEGITAIGEYAFFSCGATNIILPESVTSIGNNAFAGSNNLISITISAGVKTIGDYAFSYCIRLKDIYYGGTAEQWKNLETGAVYGNYTVRCTDGDIKETDNY